MSEDTRPTCFIAMPITTRAHEADLYGGDAKHWNHVMETIFVPAVERAGFRPLRPVAIGSHMIHEQIIRHLSHSDMVLCDLSGHNPNVFFELGVRTSLNLPISLVRDEHTDLPFDTSGINTHEYASTLRGWEIEWEVGRLAQHLSESVQTCDGENPLWRRFGLAIAARTPLAGTSSSDARLELIFEGMTEVRSELSEMRRLARSGITVASGVTWRDAIRRLVLPAAEEVAAIFDSSVDEISYGGQDRWLVKLTITPQMPSAEGVVELAQRVLDRRGFIIEGFNMADTMNLWVVFQ